MYVSVLSDKVSRCVSFDGQGFSDEFMRKYRFAIAKNKYKTKLIAHNSDFVNILMGQFTSDITYVGGEVNVDDFSQFHCPNVLFKTIGGKPVMSIGDVTEQNPMMEMLHGYVKYITEEYPPGVTQVLIAGLADFVETMTKEGAGFIEKVFATAESGGVLGVLLRSLVEYLGQLKVNNQELYERYKKAFFVTGLYQIDNSLVSYIAIIAAWKVLFEQAEKRAVQISNRSRNAANRISGEIRDFTQKTQQELMVLVKSADNKLNRFTDGIDDLCGHLGFGNVYKMLGNVDAYNRDLFDTANMSEKDLQDLFNRVYEIDARYAKEVNEQAEKLSLVADRLKRISESIAPAA
jgi:hypothetical protein